jgi:hypothetical protein
MNDNGFYINQKKLTLCKLLYSCQLCSFSITVIILGSFFFNEVDMLVFLEKNFFFFYFLNYFNFWFQKSNFKLIIENWE